MICSAGSSRPYPRKSLRNTSTRKGGQNPIAAKTEKQAKIERWEDHINFANSTHVTKLKISSNAALLWIYIYSMKHDAKATQAGIWLIGKQEAGCLIKGSYHWSNLQIRCHKLYCIILFCTGFPAYRTKQNLFSCYDITKHANKELRLWQIREY